MECKIGVTYKLKMIQLALASFVRWHFMVHEVSTTFIETVMMPSYVSQLKKLTGLARSANTNRLFLPHHKEGLGLPSLVHLYQECQLQRALILKGSLDNNILFLTEMRETQELNKSKSWSAFRIAIGYQERFKKTQNQNVNGKSAREIMVGWLKQSNFESLETQLSNLTSQGEALRSLYTVGSSDNCRYEWLSMLIDLPPKTLKFGMNGLLNTLPTANKLKKWCIERKMPDGSKKVSSHCSLCDHDNATLSHVLCYCPYILNDGVFNRPKWRHDQVLSQTICLIEPYITDYQLLCDLSGHFNCYTSLPLINSTLRPDILLINSKEVLIAELTCPMESSLNSRHSEKTAKYQHLASLYRGQSFDVSIYAFEISARGLVADSVSTVLRS
ncbi:hypothetical protein RCL1_007127 [Eukaryota sp. TZLM3-RCL]